MIRHYITSAFRNLLKHRVQNAISIASIAIGIVTLAITHVWIQRYQRPQIYDEPYYGRMYNIILDSLDSDKSAFVSPDAILALRNGGPFLSIDGRLYADYEPCCISKQVDLHRADGSEILCPGINDEWVVRPSMLITPVDSDFPNFYAFASAITGERIRPLKEGEAIISAADAKSKFGGESPLGAYFDFAVGGQTFQATIVDVYDDGCQQDYHFEGKRLYWNIGSHYANESIICSQHSGIKHYALLKEGFSREQMEAELQEAVAPLGLSARLERCADNDQAFEYKLIHLFGYLLGSMILISAAIGFLKMQVQVFQMRKREIALRMVNGAKRGQILIQLIIELCMPIAITVLLAVMIGAWFNDFIYTNFLVYADDVSCEFDKLYLHSIRLGLLLLAVSAIIAYVTIQRVCSVKQGMAASMRRSRSHVFRNIMLWIQVFVSMFLSGLAAMFIWLIGKSMAESNIPEGHEPICYSFDVSIAGQSPELLQSLRKIGGAELIQYSHSQALLAKEFSDDPDVLERLEALQKYTSCAISNSMSYLNLKALDIKWIDRQAADSRCYFLSDTLYKALFDAGAINNNRLAISGGEPVAIAGTFRAVYLQTNSTCSLIELQDGLACDESTRYILAASPETYNQVEKELRGLCISSKGAIVLHNIDIDLEYAHSVIIVCWILALVSLIISTMGIFSTISLDTKTRRKEMAVRKINGAKNNDIARIFGRLYLIISVTAAIIVCFPINSLIESNPGVGFAPPLIAIAVVILSIALVVGLQVRKIMKVNPADIIAKE